MAWTIGRSNPSPWLTVVYTSARRMSLMICSSGRRSLMISTLGLSMWCRPLSLLWTLSLICFLNSAELFPPQVFITRTTSLTPLKAQQKAVIRSAKFFRGIQLALTIKTMLSDSTPAMPVLGPSGHQTSVSRGGMIQPMGTLTPAFLAESMRPGQPAINAWPPLILPIHSRGYLLLSHIA